MNRLDQIQNKITALISSGNPHLLTALGICFAYHGVLIPYTYTRTYDAFVHIFFGDHYARSWFDPWDSRWYTGFTLTSYPPGSQQSIALLSPFVGLGYGFVLVQIFALLMCVVGIYRFSKLWVREEAAGYAALLFVFSSSITETVHVFGQLPTTFSLGFLLNAIPFAYRWMKNGRWQLLLAAWIMNAATTAGHHVTTLFGAVFFVAPVMVLAIVEKLRIPLADEPVDDPNQPIKGNLKSVFARYLRRIVPVTARTGLYGVGMIVVLVIVVLPYWLWSQSDPISQVSIPHASRDSFIENSAAGLVFWVIPYGVSLLILPYVVYKGFTTKAWPLMMSWCLLFILGTGGTTPIPRFLLGGAFDILTLDRFTFWATIILLPFAGEFVTSLRHGRFAHYLIEHFGRLTWRTVQAGLLIAYIAASLFTANLTQFRRFQPAPIDIDPIVTFMEQDQHWRWRYLTLGFGDQVAWLSANMEANMIDGNYHSARRLPELTTAPVERLEGAKYSGMPGIGSLQQFLAVPDKYNLKFVFSNDPFYDPLLYFSGWHRLERLENGIVIWEKGDIPPLPEVLPRKDIPTYQKIMWGTVPMMSLMLGMAVMTYPFWSDSVTHALVVLGVTRVTIRIRGVFAKRFPFSPSKWGNRWWLRMDEKLRLWSISTSDEVSPAMRWLDYVNRWQKPQISPPSARLVRRTAFVFLLLATAMTATYFYQRQVRGPLRVVEAYYDDLDFRRFEEAYSRLDPEQRPDYEQYVLELSVGNGLVASYGKLDSVFVTEKETDDGRMLVEVEAFLLTALDSYVTTRVHELIQRNGRWFIVPDLPDVAIPPDQFYRRSDVDWYSAGRRRVTVETTSFGDVLDRPELQILSARLVWKNGRYSVVGELINTDADPADITVAAYLFDEDGNELVWYNAQQTMIHKLLPKEVTPFRVDFEGVAGLALAGRSAPLEFEPNAFYPLDLSNAPFRFEIYGRALVTGYDLSRYVTAQDMRVEKVDSGQFVLSGELHNTGTAEATIPHLLLTYYDENNQVVWVDDFYLPEGVRPQRTRPFSVPITLADELETLIDNGDVYANVLQQNVSLSDDWLERFPLPEGTGYDSVRVSVHYFTRDIQE